MPGVPRIHSAMTTCTFEHTRQNRHAGLRIPGVYWMALGLIFAVSLPNLLDPFVAHDDFPALFLDPALYWEKTLNEGRWLNYIWHLRAFETPAWLNFAVYQALWAVFAASLATAALPGERDELLRVILAGLVVLAPPAMLISFWFNTLMPGLALVALFGVIVCRAPERVSRAVLPVFVIATFHAYPMYPLLLLALCLARSDKPGLFDLCGLLALFGGGFVAAMASSYVLNWHYHGVFDVPLAPWREATPATDLASLLQNLPKAWESLVRFSMKASLNSRVFVVLNLSAFLAASFYLIRHAPWRLVYLGAGLATGVALVVLQSVKLGVIVPPRACLFIWVFHALVMLAAVQVSSQRASPRYPMAVAVLMTVIAAYAVEATSRYAAHRDWQDLSRAVSAALADAPGPILVFGRPMQTEAGRQASIQHDLALVFRVRHLADRDVFLCDLQMEHCAGRAPSQAARNAANPWSIHTSTNGTTLIFAGETP